MKYLCDACQRLVDVGSFSVREGTLVLRCPQCAGESTGGVAQEVRAVSSAPVVQLVEARKRASGIDPSVAYEVLARSAVGAPYVGYKRAAFLEPDATPVAFALELAAKDLRLIDELATSVGLELPQAGTNLAVIEAAATERGSDQDFATVARYLAERRHR